MNSPLRFGLRSLPFVLLATLAGCGADQRGGSSDNEPTPPPSTSPDPSGSNGGEAARAISEADIIQIDGDRLYAMSKSGTVSIVDISSRTSLSLLGQTRIAGEPFEMYRRGDLLVAMTNRAVSPQGVRYVATTATASITAAASTKASIDAGAGAAVIVLDVGNPRDIRTVATSPIPGEMADSRVVGNVLYTATYENARCFECASKPRTVVTSFDITRPNDLRQVDQVFFQSDAPEGFNASWGSAWKRSIFVTNERLYIGGHGDIEPTTLAQGTSAEGIIDVLDITDPNGKLAPGAHLTVAGALLSRWQIDERNGILRVVSQKGAGRTANGIGFPEVATFTIASSQSFVPLGGTQLRLPRQEGLRTVRFDQDRAYAITYNQTDPLFVIDLRDPAQPRTRGELHMPGFMFHLEPHGDRLLGLGVDRTDTAGSLNVSLFDVADMDDPRMLQRVSFGATGISEDYAILNFEVPEDQDRIQKAFRVLDGGLVVVPHTVPRKGSYAATSCADGLGGAVQLVEWQGDTLTKLASLPMQGNARRAFLHQDRILAVSDSNVTAFDASRRTEAVVTGDVEIGECVSRTLPNSGVSVGGGAGSRSGSRSGSSYDDERGGRYMCTTSGGLGYGESTSPLALGVMATIAISAAARRRRAAKARLIG